MSALDIALLLLIAAALAFAVGFIISKKKKGESCCGCGGDCLNCKNNKNK